MEYSKTFKKIWFGANLDVSEKTDFTHKIVKAVGDLKVLERKYGKPPQQ